MRKLNRSLLLVGALALTGGLAACGDDVTVAGPSTPAGRVSGVTVSPATASVRIGGSVQLNAGVSADSGVTSTVAWKSSDATIATVDASGKVTGVKAGTVGITATATATNGSSASGSATITVTNASNVQSIVLNPTAIVLNPGQTQGINATVTLDPTSTSSDKGVTWASSDNTIATVDAAGVVTAVKPGNATITATANADSTSKATASVTVRTPAPTQISVQSITVQGNLNQTVDVNNVAGPIDVTLNVDPGDNVVSKVEVLIDNTVVCSQAFSGAQSQALRVAAAKAEAAPVPVVCQINTAKFDTLTGAITPWNANGTHQLTARAITSTGQQVATPSTQLVFNNTSGFVFSVTNQNDHVIGGTTFPNSAVNPVTGLSWIAGNVTVKLLGVSYIAGSSFTQANVQMFGQNVSVPVTNGVATVFYADTVGGTNSIANYQSPGAGESPVVTASVITGGNAGSTVTLNGLNAAIPALPVTRLDNLAPAAPVAAGTMPIWVNGAFAFTNANAGVTQGADAGVNNVKTDYYTAATSTLTGSCSTTGTTKTTTGSQLAGSVTSTTYQAKAVEYDALGNAACALVTTAIANQFGADFRAPSITTGSIIGGVSNQGTYTAAQTVDLSVAAADTGTSGPSGFSATPIRVVSNIQTAPGTFVCYLSTGTAPACATPSQQPLIFPATGATEGYYTLTADLLDQAGNATNLYNGVQYLYDVTPPTFSGGISLQSSYVGNQPGSFSISASDNINLGTATGVLQYGAVDSLQYPAQSLSTFGAFNTSQTINLQIPQIIACLSPNSAGPIPAGTKLSQVDITLKDFAGNAAAAPATQAIGGAYVPTCSTVGITPINTFTSTSAAATISKTGAGGNPTSTLLRADANVTGNTSPDPFSRVEFWYRVTGAGTPLKFLGSTTSVPVQAGGNRDWLYSFTLSASALANANYDIVAIGVDANGNAVLSTVAPVSVIP